jgi:hypothetical protein
MWKRKLIRSGVKKIVLLLLSMCVGRRRGGVVIGDVFVFFGVRVECGRCRSFYFLSPLPPQQ